MCNILGIYMHRNIDGIFKLIGDLDWSVSVGITGRGREDSFAYLAGKKPTKGKY